MFKMFGFKLFVVLNLHLFWFQFILAQSPKLNQFIKHQAQKNGTKFSIFCTVQEGSKPIKFEWWFNDQHLASESDPGFRIDALGDEQSLFTIAKLEPEHSGQYSCTANNDHGSDTQRTMLLVKGLIPDSYDDILSILNQSVALNFALA